MCASRRCCFHWQQWNKCAPALIYVKQKYKSRMPLPSLSLFIAVPATLFPIIKSHLKQHENDIAITELPLLLSGQSAGKAQPINQRALQGLHIQTAFFEEEGCGTLKQPVKSDRESRGSLSVQQRLLSALCSLSLSAFSKQEVCLKLENKEEQLNVCSDRLYCVLCSAKWQLNMCNHVQPWSSNHQDGLFFTLRVANHSLLRRYLLHFKSNISLVNQTEI